MQTMLEKALPLIIIIAAIGAALLQIPAIAVQKDAAADAQASRDITDIKTAISMYALDKDAMPERLQDLDLDNEFNRENLAKYSYEVNDAEDTYKLCTDFKTDTQKSDMPISSSSRSYGSEYQSTTEHPKGRHCFTYPQPYMSGSRSTDSNFNIYDSYNTYDSGAFDGSTDTVALDVDLKAIATQAEAYYNGDGKKSYPSQSNMYSSTWRKANLKGLADESTTSDAGKSIGAIGGYTYTPAPSGCNGTTVKCTSFTLRGKADSGASSTRYSLNY